MLHQIGIRAQNDQVFVYVLHQTLTLNPTIFFFFSNMSFLVFPSSFLSSFMTFFLFLVGKKIDFWSLSLRLLDNYSSMSYWSFHLSTSSHTSLTFVGLLHAATSLSSSQPLNHCQFVVACHLWYFVDPASALILTTVTFEPIGSHT